MRRPPALTNVVLLVAVVVLAACRGDGSGWVPDSAPPAGPRTISRSLGEAVTLRGADGVALRVSVDFLSRPAVPITLSPETATFLEVHLTVANAGGAPYSGVLADAADLTVVPAVTLAPVRTESVPNEIPISGGLDFAEPVTIAPGSPPLSGKVVFQVDPDDEASSFSLTIAGARETAEWAL